MNAWPTLIKRDLYLGKNIPIGAVNPTLTIIADALRLADIIKQRLG